MKWKKKHVHVHVISQNTFLKSILHISHKTHYILTWSSTAVVQRGPPARGMSSIQPVSACLRIHLAAVLRCMPSLKAIAEMLCPSAWRAKIANRFACEVSIVNVISTIKQQPC